MENYGALRGELSAALVRWRRDDLLSALTAAGVPSGAVRTVTEALADPQLNARAMIVPLEHVSEGSIRVLGSPLKLSETPVSIHSAPPALGQHTAAILENDAGLTQAEIKSLRSSGVIG